MFTTLRVPLLPGGWVQSWDWSGQLMCVYTSMAHCNIQFHRITVALKMTKTSTSVCTHFIKTNKYRSSTITMQVFVDLNWLANDNWKCSQKCINDLRSHWQNTAQNADNTQITLISFSDGIRVSNANAVIPNIATIGSARMKYGELAQLKHSDATNIQHKSTP